MKRLFGKTKENSGFTLAEMLIVIAITVILLGVSVLGISSMAKSFTMTELDRYAKTIYLEAQNQLAAKEVEGGMFGFYTEVYEEFTGENGYFTRAIFKPQGWDDSTGEAWKNFCYLLKDDSQMSPLVANITGIYDGSYVIELNPQTGDIYSVFYWKDNRGESIEEYYKKYIGGLASRDRKDREALEVGYYGGHHVETVAPSDFKLNQKVEVINDEELYIKISYDASAKLIQKYMGNLSIKFTIKDESGGEWIDFLGKENVKINAATSRLEVYMLLDSMEAGQGFAQITRNRLKKGDNLSITVESFFTDAEYNCTEKSKPVITNSLFANKVLVQPGDRGLTRIELKHLRHLYNLQESIYGGTSLPVHSVYIEQMNDLDYRTNSFAWDYVADEGNPANSGMQYIGIRGQEDSSNRPSTIQKWSPLVNAVLWKNDDGSRTTYDGGHYRLKNFHIVGTPYGTGIFAAASYTDFKNIRIEDFIVEAEGSNYVGTLAGTMDHCTIEDCGAYLSTYTEIYGKRDYYFSKPDESGVYEDDMTRRFHSFTVTGKQNVGGLVGALNNCSYIGKAYASVKVTGEEQVGGLFGRIENTIITNSYSGGEVYGTKEQDGRADAIGGLIGEVTNNVAVWNSYSASNVYGAEYLGGFVGISGNAKYENCSSYGEVLNLKGQINFGANNKAGGFISASGSNGDTFHNCYYLTQKDYNLPGDFEGGSPVGAKDYGLFAREAAGITVAGASLPYKASLGHVAFPFAKVMEHHYGNWPTQFIISNALVYYEKYETLAKDGSRGYYYGYYCVTKLEEDGRDKKIWVLDTLEDKECVEDGYALLSMYKLTSLDYRLHVGSQVDAGKAYDSLSISTTPSAETMVTLRQQGGLGFSAYDEAQVQTEIAKTEGMTYQELDYSKLEEVGYIMVSGMYLYQLPYQLQNPNRVAVDNFYDYLEIDNGFASGNPEEAVLKDLSFYYCPHFAKTAVNPGLSSQGAGGGQTLLENPNHAYVRSARHLNALGYNPYYWNDKGGNEKPITYVQEVDVNFGTYTKLYCGEVFDMGIDGNVKNIPIGMPKLDKEGNHEQFRNTYDGMCNKIIDYSLQCEDEFAGLFGEIQEATLRNIVMVVSQDYESNLADGNPENDKYGLITSTFYDYDGDRRAGLGALVGLAYQGGNSITNCTAAGYRIVYDIQPTKNGSDQPAGIAVGGLVGISMSYMSNCSANNHVSVDINADYRDRDGSVFIGGLAGSFGYATMKNCYSGGSLNVNKQPAGVEHHIYRLRIGGLCPGMMYTPGADTSEDTIYENIYTFVDVSDKVWEVYETTDKDKHFNHYIPVVGRMRVLDDTTRIWDDVTVNGIRHYIELNGSFFGENRIDPREDTPKVYFQKISRYWSNWSFHSGPELSTLATYEELAGFADFAAVDGSVPSQTISLPYAKELEGLEFPFPAVNTDEEGNYIHYGDWPLRETE